ncbi:glycoside hydrolase family 88 protein [Xanthobacter sp. V3C-3]|uniref:glycoside hydrolase family 88 protein n=1 Tax=Xanthobacter lutulentifluminis TaxID=3119935 RepID=UPI003729A52C
MKAHTNAQIDLYRNALDLLATKLLEDEGRLGVAFPYVTAPDGSWQTMLASESAGYGPSGWSHGNWFCGFWVGLLLASHLHTGDPRHLAIAQERMRLVAQRADDPNTHDIGFIFNASAVPLHHVTGDADLAAIGLAAAERLRSRTVMTDRGAYLSSWGPLDDARARCSSAIDTMANLALLYWASRHTGDASYALAAVAHADMTRGAFIRPDQSTYHAVQYDLPSGARARGYTFQGHADESCWSRGQGWAILGYADTAAATGRRDYLELANTLADHFLARIGDDPVAFYDFDDPAIPDSPRDTAASAIVANALLKMADLDADAERSALRRGQGLWLLEGLCRTSLAQEGSHRGLLKHGCYSRPHDIGPDSAVLFGDYYFVEALCQVVMPGRFRPTYGTI